MVRLFFLGGIVAASVAVPMAFQSDPQIVEDLLRMAMPGRPVTIVAAGPDDDASAARPAPPRMSGREVTLPADALGHFSAGFRINGRPVEGMIDTGATLVALNSSTARRVGISLNPSDFTHRVSTANGSVKAAVVTLDRLELGRIELTAVQAMILDDSMLQTNLIGMSFLSRLARYEVSDGTMLLAQ